MRTRFVRRCSCASSLTRAAGVLPCNLAAIGTMRCLNSGFANDRSSSEPANRRSTYNGSVRYLPASVLGMASVRSRSKRLTASSQCSSPSVRTMTSESRSRSLSQNSISCCTHFDDAARGDASRMNCPDLLSAPSIDGHVPGLAERSVSSRNTLSARALYQGFASLCRAD